VGLAAKWMGVWGFSELTYELKDFHCVVAEEFLVDST